MQVVDGLYLGDISSLALVRAGETHAITAVLSLLSGPQESYCELDAIPAHVHRLYIAIDDALDSSILRRLNEALAFIHQHARPPERNVLAHCFAGESRSAAIAVAYMLAIAPIPSLDNALNALRQKYPSAAPNRAFMRQLQVFEAFCRDERRRDLSPSDTSRDMISLERWLFTPLLDLDRLSSLSTCTRLLALEEPLHILAAAKARGHQTIPSDVFLSLGSLGASRDGLRTSQRLRNIYSARCRSCRSVLASSLCLLRGEVLRDSTVSVPPLFWMKSVTEVIFASSSSSSTGTVERLRCPRCDARVGSCGWQRERTDSGEDFGMWQPAPYFHLNKSAVDWIAEHDVLRSNGVDVYPRSSK